MVNIQSVIYVGHHRSEPFNSFPEYLAFALRISSPMHRAKLLQFKQLSDAFSQVVASKYGFTQEETANVAYLFGHIKEATNRLEDVAVRNLVFNLENRLVVELKNSPSRGSYTVLTIHRDDDYEIITTIVRQPPLTVPDAEW